MFTPDGTHRADADIAVDVTRAIEDLIKQGVIKPQNAPAKPIMGFDDANKYLDNYPTGATESLKSAPAPTTPVPAKSTLTAPVEPASCPADRPWLCEAAPAPAKPLTTSAKGPAETGSAPASAPANAGNTPTSGPANSENAPATSSAAKPSTSAGGKPAAKGSKTTTATASKPPAPADSPLYVLGANDVVQVSVFDEPRVTSTYAIGPDGRMSMPLVGNFKAIDMTIPQLTDLLTTKLRDEGGILEPVVNVQLLRNNSKQYTLIGGAGRTGPVPLLRETTIFDALVAASFKEFAKRKNIILRRGTKEFHFNYDQVLKGIHMEQNILIQDGDYIIVHE
jgi:polysaccharide biosynthesis/export protein